MDGRIFRAVTVNGGEPELIGEDSYTYTGTMDTLNPTLSFAFETVSKTTLQAVIDYAQARIDAGDVDNLVPAVQEKFQKAFDAAVEVNDDPAATQDEINEAWSNLLDALHYLDFTVGDKTKLEEAGCHCGDAGRGRLYSGELGGIPGCARSGTGDRRR